MSEGWRYVCLSHDPHLLADREVNHGRDALFDTFMQVRAGTWPRVPDGYGGTEPIPVSGSYFSEVTWPIQWLDEHPRCRVAILGEYGDTYFTDGGLLRQVSGPDRSKHWVRPPGTLGQAKVNLIPGEYPPEGMLRCTCVSPVLAVTDPRLSPRDGWVLCTTCGGTSRPIDRG